MTENKFNIQLEPKGKFLITLADGIRVKGRFSMYALDRFATAKGLSSYMELIGKITVGMTLREYADLVVFAIEDYYREDYEQCTVLIDGRKQRWTADLVMDHIIEDMGGLGNKQSLSFFKHAIGRLTEIIEEEPEQQKKSEEQSSQ